MSVKLTLKRFDELKAELLATPQTLTDQAQDRADHWARQAAGEIAAAYPLGPPGRKRKGTAIRPGNLRRGIRIVVGPGKEHRRRIATSVFSKTTAATTVVNVAPHAYLFEYGSAARQTATGAGRGAMWGKKPKPFIFIKAIIRLRLAFLQDVFGDVQKHGLTVHSA